MFRISSLEPGQNPTLDDAPFLGERAARRLAEALSPGATVAIRKLPVDLPQRCCFPATSFPNRSNPALDLVTFPELNTISSFAEQGLAMLVLSRKKDEKIIIGDKITIMVIEIRGDKVRLGIDAPKDVTVHRQEVYEAIKREHEDQRASL